MAWGITSGQVNALADHVIRRKPCEELSIKEMDAVAEKMIQAGILGGTGGLIGGAGTVAGKVFNLPGLSNLKSSQSGAVTGIVANSVSAIGLGVN
jgi:hypothetical protein